MGRCGALVAAMLTLLTACDRSAPTRTGASGSAATTAAPATPRAPRALWQTYCASCHGPTGRGSPVATVVFDATWQTARCDSLIRARITNGVPNTTMAPWGRMLTSAEVDGLVGYVRQLGSAR
ncbi:MAG: cytochrome c [Gemmatimonadaceae bacterium]|nr:cytochrome c [Gemmatimonadaceae bacterium]